MVTSLPRRLEGVAGGQGGPSACRDPEARVAAKDIATPVAFVAAPMMFIAAPVTFAGVAAFRYDCR